MKSARSVQDGIDTLFTPEMFEEVKLLFTNHATDGIVTVNAISKGLKSIGYEIEPLELHDRMSEVDPDRSGALDFAMYMKMMETLLKEWNLEEVHYLHY